MKPEMKQKWVEALRSGKYKQGQRRLKVPNEDGSFSHCCLGVLCEINGVEFTARYDYTDNRVFGVGYRGLSFAYPSADHREEWELPFTQVREVAGLNDQGKTFAEIADYIEENL